MPARPPLDALSLALEVVARLDRNIPLTRVRVFLAIALHPGISRAELDRKLGTTGETGTQSNLTRHIAALRGVAVQGADPVSIPLITKIRGFGGPVVPGYFLTPTGRGVARDMIRALFGYEQAEAFDAPVYRPDGGAPSGLG